MKHVTAVALIALIAVAGEAGAQNSANSPTMREAVTGIGGFFFRAHDPKKLALWYRDELGVALTPRKYGDQPWRQEAGPTAFQPFHDASPDTDPMFGDPHKDFILNFRVRNLDRMVAQLRADTIHVDVDPTLYPNGRFASLKDPEGNPIQLWEPAEQTGE